MTLGTHNSATGGELLWWLKPLAWIINPTSKCQDRTIQEQLADATLEELIEWESFKNGNYQNFNRILRNQRLRK